MTAPTLESGPFVFNVNNLFSESSLSDCAKRILLELKNGLVALGGAGVIWQVVASSDSTAVKNIGDVSPDLWSTISDLVYVPAAGTPHSWIVLENQTTGSQFCIDYRGQSSPYYVRVSFSPNGTFSTDGTISDIPTVTDHDLIWPHWNYFLNSLSSGFKKFALHIMTSANHKTTRWFVVQKNTIDGSLMYASHGMIEEVVNVPAVWTSTNKYAIERRSASVTYSPTPSQQSPRLYDVDGALWRVYLETAEPYSAWNSCNPTTPCYGNSLHLVNGQPLLHNSANQTLFGGYPVSPISLFRITNPRGGSYGRLRDVYYAQYSQEMYDTCPSDASREWLKIGCYLVPWNGSVPLHSE